MRPLVIVLAVLAACAPDVDPSADGGSPIADASEALCPLIGTPGVLGANWYPDSGCAYRCDPETQIICGAVVEGGRLRSWGVCTPLLSHDNCGLCGRACASNEQCVASTIDPLRYTCRPR